MKKLRKIVAIAMTAALTCSVLAGCGGAAQGGNTASVKSWLYIPQSDMDKYIFSPEEDDVWCEFFGKWEDLSSKYIKKDIALLDEYSPDEEEYHGKIDELEVQYQKELTKLEEERDAELEKLELTSEEDVDKSMSDSEYEEKRKKIWADYRDAISRSSRALLEKLDDLLKQYRENKISQEEYYGGYSYYTSESVEEAERMADERDAALAKLEAERNS